MKVKPVRRVKERGAAYATRTTKSRAPSRALFPQARYLTQEERIALKAYKDYLLEKLPDQIERIILFGSKARGDSRRDSDVDLLVAIDGRPIEGLGTRDPRWHAIVDPIFDFLMKYDVYLSPQVMQVDQLNSWTPLLAHVQKDGVILWRKPKKTA